MCTRYAASSTRRTAPTPSRAEYRCACSTPWADHMRMRKTVPVSEPPSLSLLLAPRPRCTPRIHAGSRLAAVQGSTPAGGHGAAAMTSLRFSVSAQPQTGRACPRLAADTERSAGRRALANDLARRQRPCCKNGAKPNSADLRGERALPLAVRAGRLELVRQLLVPGCVEPDLRGADGRTALGIAALDGNAAVVRRTAQARRRHRPARRPRQYSPLLDAVLMNRVEVVRLLLGHRTRSRTLRPRWPARVGAGRARRPRRNPRSPAEPMVRISSCRTRATAPRCSGPSISASGTASISCWPWRRSRCDVYRFLKQAPPIAPQSPVP
jgi:hypothetical protein